MRETLKVVSWIAIVIGSLTILDGLPTAEYYADVYAIVGGLMFAGQGILALVYINQVDRGQDE